MACYPRVGRPAVVELATPPASLSRVCGGCNGVGSTPAGLQSNNIDAFPGAAPPVINVTPFGLLGARGWQDAFYASYAIDGRVAQVRGALPVVVERVVVAALLDPWVNKGRTAPRLGGL